MLPVPGTPPFGGYLLPVAVAGVTVLVPLTVGFLVGYRTVGRTRDRLRAGARAGLLLTGLATLAVGGYALPALRAASYDTSTLITLVPTIAVVWLLLAGLYTVSVSVIGSVLGGYARTRRAHAST